MKNLKKENKIIHENIITQYQCHITKAAQRYPFFKIIVKQQNHSDNTKRIQIIPKKYIQYDFNYTKNSISDAKISLFI